MVKYNINGNIFNSKKSVKDYFKDIKDKHIPNTKLKDRHSDDFNDLIDLFKHHEKYEEKLEYLLDIVIKKNPSNHNAFYIIKSNSDEDEDISYLHIINNCLGNSKVSIIEKRQKENLKSAMRYAIYQQKIDFKSNCKEVYCKFCRSKTNLEIDHVVEFKILYEDFLKKTKMIIPNVFDNCSKTHASVFRKEDKSFSDEWYDYHLKNTSFRYLCKKCNCARNRKNKINIEY
jgi:hypothetical protein